MASELAAASIITDTEVDGLTRYDTEGSAFHIRELKGGDGDALLRFYTDFEPKRGAQGLPPEGAVRVARWLEGVLSRGIHLVVEREGELIGHAFVTPTPREGIGEYAVFLHQEQRSRGIGTELNRAMADEARSRGLRGLWLSVEPHNRAAIRSYKKAGFRFVPQTVFTIEPEMEMTL